MILVVIFTKTFFDRIIIMNYKNINTDGIEYIESLEGTNDWYWGLDYCNGDLYEAEELYRSGHTINGNRLVFVKYPEGKVIEPIIKKEGQYFGRPVYDNNAIVILLADFKENKIKIIRYIYPTNNLETLAIIDRSTIIDCYNLFLRVSPLYLSRDGKKGTYEILWPEKFKFKIEKNESIFKRDNDILISSRWYENQTYHEDTIIREYKTGKILKIIPGQLKEMPDKQNWIIS